jgi:excisionase family DNA binding protein
MAQEYMTTKEASAMLGMSPTNVYRLASGGLIPCCKIGGVWRFPTQRIREWIDEKSIVNVGSTKQDRWINLIQ